MSRPLSLKTVFCLITGAACAAAAAGHFLSQTDAPPPQDTNKSGTPTQPYYPPIDASDFFSFGR